MASIARPAILSKARFDFVVNILAIVSCPLDTQTEDMLSSLIVNAHLFSNQIATCSQRKQSPFFKVPYT